MRSILFDTYNSNAIFIYLSLNEKNFGTNSFSHNFFIYVSVPYFSLVNFACLFRISIFYNILCRIILLHSNTQMHTPLTQTLDFQDHGLHNFLALLSFQFLPIEFLFARPNFHLCKLQKVIFLIWQIFY